MGYLIKEDLLTLANLIADKQGYKITVKNLLAINSGEPVNSLVIRVDTGNIDRLIEKITKIYNFKAEKFENNIVLFTGN